MDTSILDIVRISTITIRRDAASCGRRTTTRIGIGMEPDGMDRVPHGIHGITVRPTGMVGVVIMADGGIPRGIPDRTGADIITIGLAETRHAPESQDPTDLPARQEAPVPSTAYVPMLLSAQHRLPEAVQPMQSTESPQEAEIGLLLRT
jgi:hypothetical protein